MNRFQLPRFGCLLIVAGALLCGSPAAHAQHTVAEQYLFAALNSSRVRAGLPELRWDERLSAAAAQHANAMSRSEIMTHQLDGEADLPERAAISGTRFSVIAENVGVGSSALDLHGAWMQSPGHKENMLDSSMDAVGIAVMEHNGYVWAVEDFARTVPDVSLSSQERQVAGLLLSAGLQATPSSAARAMCQQYTGYIGTRPLFIMRYSAANLNVLPAALVERIQQGRASQAAVGACAGPQNGFTAYSIAVALYR